MPSERIVVGMSGGVDSAVAALLLKEQGYDVVGVFMKNWEEKDDEGICTAAADYEDVRRVCDAIGIPYSSVNFTKEYWERVFQIFLSEYAAGRTPNPDILCNKEIKFRAFLDYAMNMGAECIATGHYARTRIGPDGKTQLLRGLDETKDQSYFLHRLSQEQISKVIFPVGELRKTQVRKIAEEIGLPNAKKKDSTGICFIGERPFREFLNRYLPTHPGPMKTPDGRVVGEHMGLAFYTLGQRKGIGMGGSRDGNGEPWFVAKKDMATNTLWIAQGHDHPWLLSHHLTAVMPSWVSGVAPEAGSHLTVKTRYRQTDGQCTVSAISDDAFTLNFPQPQWAVTPGQSAVIYDGEVCIGGGFIDVIDQH